MREFLGIWALLLAVLAVIAVIVGALTVLSYVALWNPYVGVPALTLAGTALVAAAVTWPA